MTAPSDKPAEPASRHDLTPGPAEIVRWRVGAVAVLRIGAIVACVVAAWPVASWLLEGLRDEDLFEMEYYGARLVGAAMLLVGGSVAWFGAPAIAGWVVTLPTRPLCPGCGFDLTAIPATRCPECALELPPTTLVPSPPAGPSYARWRIAAVLAIRLIALLYLLFTLQSNLSWAAWLVFFPSDFITTEWWQIAVILLQLVLQLLLGVVLWVLAPRITRRALRAGGLWEPFPCDPPG